MISQLLNFLLQNIVRVVSATGYFGVGILMLFESCGIPVPSEIIMPFAGFLVALGRLDFWLAALIGALGNLLGSLLAYGIGYAGGRPLVEKYGKYLLISHHDLDLADRWFTRRGQWIVFIGRLLPVVRTYISFPAGISKMDIKKFSLFTFAGALPWCLLFTYFGVKLQNNWTVIHDKLHNLDYLVVLGIIVLFGWYVVKHLRERRLGRS